MYFPILEPQSRGKRSAAPSQAIYSEFPKHFGRPEPEYRPWGKIDRLLGTVWRGLCHARSPWGSAF